MRITKSTILPLLLFCGIGALSAWWFRWLWHERVLIAVLLSALLMLGVGLLPVRSKWLHAISVGICFGAFIGGCLALVGAANHSFQPTPTARLN
jgi:cyanate permease